MGEDGAAVGEVRVLQTSEVAGLKRLRRGVGKKNLHGRGLMKFEYCQGKQDPSSKKREKESRRTSRSCLAAVKAS